MLRKTLGVFRVDGQLTECDVETAEVLNNAFVGVLNIENNKSPVLE